MGEYLQVWRARVPEGSVEQLLELRPAAIAEAKRLCAVDEVVAIGELYRFDRFAAPASLWRDLQRRYPALLGAD